MEGKGAIKNARKPSVAKHQKESLKIKLAKFSAGGVKEGEILEKKKAIAREDHSATKIDEMIQDGAVLIDGELVLQGVSEAFEIPGEYELDQFSTCAALHP